MLSCLRVRNLAIIDELELTLSPGLTVVTGETGAGKSILVNALNLVLGARARPEVVRAGAEQAEVEALFSIDPVRMGPRLAELGLDADEEIVVRRTVQPQGRSRASINGHLATATQLQALAQGLVDICSQHEHHTLVDAATHLDHLDRFGGIEAEREQVAAAFGQAAQAARQLADTREQLRQRTEREELLRFQLSEFERLSPRPGEEDELRVERERLAHAERLTQAARSAEHRLYTADDAVCAALDRVVHELRQASRHDPSLSPIAERVESASTDLSEAARDLSVWLSHLQVDPARLAEIEERLHALKGLARRFGGDLQQALAHAARARDELSGLDELDARLQDLQAQLDQSLDRAATGARALSLRRHALAAQLGAGISAELGGLGMGDARVLVEVAPLGEAKGAELSVDGARLTAAGIDRAEFLIAPNPGEDPKPLGRVASGGELSRALLALKCVIPGIDPDGLYVFDEVDSGVGGAVAEVIARKLRAISRQHQVLCITHLPQVAAYADRHLRVEKEVVQGRTRSRIVALDEAERREELARMLGGIEVSEGSRLAADALLKAAR